LTAWRRRNGLTRRGGGGIREVLGDGDEGKNGEN